MLYKRLEKGRFKVPDPSEDSCDVVIPTGLFQELLQGLTQHMNSDRTRS